MSGLPHWDTPDEESVHNPATSGLPTMRATNGSSAVAAAAAANALLRDPLWTRFVVVRDPVVRFASAFLDKCARDLKNGNCPIQDPLRRVDPLAVLEALEATVHSARAEPGDSHAYDVAAAFGGMHALNAHFLPMSMFCDLRLTRPAWMVIAMDSQIEMRQALAEVARQLHPASGSIRGLREDFSRWAMEALLPSKVRHNTSASLLVERWRQAAAKNELYADTAGYLPGSVTNVAPSDFLRRVECLYGMDYHYFAGHVPPATYCTDTFIAR